MIKLADTEAYKTNRAAMELGVTRLREELAKANAGGGPKYQERHLKKGKLLPRERVERLLDDGSYFLELCPLAGVSVQGETPGCAVVSGIGLVSGTPCLIIANEATVKAGALSVVGIQKLARLAKIADENHLPVLYLVESAGVDLPFQSQIFVPGGREFRDLTRKSKARIPTIAVVFGSCTAGGAYVPGMSDYAILVRGEAKMFLAGPPLVKMAIQEIVDDETLGGAVMHSTKSGVSDYLAEDELEGLRLAREIVASLNPPDPAFPRLAPVEEPIFSADELLGVPSANPRVPFDPREIVIRIVDGSKFHEFKPLFGPTLVTGFARLHGFPIGILANHGILDSEAASKGAQFIALCNQQHIPLLFLQNTTGFVVGKKAEETGIIKNGGKLINAVANSEVPAITIMIGGSYGAGNYAMCGRAYEPRFLFTWPNHRIAVMGPEQLAGVMEIIKRDAAKKEGREVDEAAIQAVRKQTEEAIARESDAFFATGRIWDDGVIDPRDTRTVVAIALSVACARGVKGTLEWGVYRH